jgi:hypothetical protein
VLKDKIIIYGGYSVSGLAREVVVLLGWVQIPITTQQFLKKEKVI